MTDQTKTTGTESPDDGNELEQSAATAPEGSDDRNAESGEADKTDWKALAISLQEKAKRVNELERENAELKEGSQQPPVADASEFAEPVPGTFEYFLERKDPVAAEVRRTQRAMILQRQLDKMRLTDEEEQAVVDHFNKNAHRLGDYRAARAELEAPRLARELKEARDKLALLDKPPDPDVMKAPPTHGREIGARETKSKMLTEDQFDREAARIRAEQGELAELKYRERLGRDIQLKQ